MAIIPFPLSFSNMNVQPTAECWNTCCGILAPFSLSRVLTLLEPPESEWVTAKVNCFDPSDGTMRYKCRSCEGFIHYQSYKQKKYLNYDRLKYACNKCDRKYMTKKQLRAHQFRHSEKTRECSHCSKRFLTASELRNHTNTHTREKPFKCPVCPKTFGHSSMYYCHVRKAHRKYDCYTCFTNSQLTPKSAEPDQPISSTATDSSQQNLVTVSALILL